MWASWDWSFEASLGWSGLVWAGLRWNQNAAGTRRQALLVLFTPHCVYLCVKVSSFDVSRHGMFLTRSRWHDF